MKLGIPVKISDVSDGSQWPFFLIPVVLNGQGPFDFALEIHYGKTTLFRECVAKLDLDVETVATTITMPGHGCELDFPVLRLSSIEVGAATLQDFEVMVFATRDVRYHATDDTDPRPQISMMKAEYDTSPAIPYFGILGYDFLKNFK